jgi:hypothetical protein
MAVEALTKYLEPMELRLEEIYLDPNNPRFVNTSWTYVEDARIDNREIQETVQQELVERFGVEKLRMNMELNGFLPIDRVIVRSFSKDKYVVLEGNRRICAAKMIGNIALDGSTVEQDVKGSLVMIPCLLYTGDANDAAWVFQGLRHITGINDWSSFNKAKLLVEQMENEGLSLTDVGRRFGLTSHGAGQWVRGYYAFKQAREDTDYITEVDERSYPFFQELFGRSNVSLRNWLDWDENSYKFRNAINYNEFVGWLYPKADDDDGTDGDTPRGNWDDRKITRRDELRQLSWLLSSDKQMFEQFRTGTEIEQAYSLALTKQNEAVAKEKSDPTSDLFSILSQCAKALDNMPMKVVRDTELKNQLDEHIAKLQEAINFVSSN